MSTSSIIKDNNHDTSSESAKLSATNRLSLQKGLSQWRREMKSKTTEKRMTCLRDATCNARPAKCFLVLQGWAAIAFTFLPLPLLAIESRLQVDGSATHNTHNTNRATRDKQRATKAPRASCVSAENGLQVSVFKSTRRFVFCLLTCKLMSANAKREMNRAQL